MNDFLAGFLIGILIIPFMLGLKPFIKLLRTIKNKCLSNLID